METDGSGYTVLKQFHGADGSMPRADLLLGGEMLFGATESGGQFVNGTVFMLNTNGSGFAVIWAFKSDYYGAWAPRGGLAMSGTTLLGTTYRGGNQDGGTMFKLVMPAPPSIQRPPMTQTAEVGATVRFGVLASGDPVLAYQWYFNQVNLDCHEAILELTNVQPSQVGAYSVLVTNQFWPATRAQASLNVVAPVERRSVPAIDLFGEAGVPLNLEYTDAVGPAASWLPLAAVSPAKLPEVYYDLSAPLPRERFYRVWQTGAPSMAPTLGLPNMIPALTLTGAPGDLVRVDGINQFGPTDAWFTLDTVTLTNTSQLYFDVTAPGQPPRLYRLVPVP